MAACNPGPNRIEAPNWDPPAVADRIVRELDKNGDAHVDSEEWTAAPGLAAGARHIDKDRDGRLSHEELEARFEQYRKMRVGLRAQTYRVTYRRRPVAGAELVFEPEPFLGGEIEPARGTTDWEGIITPQTDGEDLPGMKPGYYRVEITSPEVKIPEKYSTAAILGVEASPLRDDPFASGMGNLRLTD